MKSHSFTLHDATGEDTPPEPFTFEHRGEYAAVRWEGCTHTVQTERPEVSMENYNGVAHARVYHPYHDEPLVTIEFDKAGNVTCMLVRRSSAIPLVFEDITPVYANPRG